MTPTDLAPCGTRKPPGSGDPSAFRPPSAGTFRLTARGARGSTYLARLARSPEEVRAAQKLRFEVLHLEMKERLEQSYATGPDAEPFDAACDHLIVEELGSGQLVGTCRLQPGPRGTGEWGYDRAQEFDVTSHELLRGVVVELGWACIAPDHRNMFLIQLLWRSVALYARALKAHCLFGCNSIGSTCDQSKGGTAPGSEQKDIPSFTG